MSHVAQLSIGEAKESLSVAGVGFCGEHEGTGRSQDIILWINNSIVRSKCCCYLLPRFVVGHCLVRCIQPHWAIAAVLRNRESDRASKFLATATRLGIPYTAATSFCVVILYGGIALLHRQSTESRAPARSGPNSSRTEEGPPARQIRHGKRQQNIRSVDATRGQPQHRQK